MDVLSEIKFYYYYYYINEGGKVHRLVVILDNSIVILFRVLENPHNFNLFNVVFIRFPHFLATVH